MTGRTWDDPGGPMVEPPEDPTIQARVDAVLAELTAAASSVMAVQGRRVSDRLAAEAAERRDRIGSSVAMSEYAKSTRGPGHEYVTHAELERRRSTFDGALDERHLALRADRSRRRRRAA